MAEFAEREQAFNSGLGETMGSFAIAAVEADSAAKDATIERYINLLERGNVDFKTDTTLVGMDEKLEVGLSVPVISVAPIEPIVVDEAEIKMSMTVSAHQEQSDSRRKQKDTDQDIEVALRAKIGPFSASVKSRTRIKASLATSSDKKRSSDYSATTDARMLLKQGPPPEGLMKVMDAITSVTAKSVEINERLIERQAEQMAAQIDQIEELPEGEAEVEAEAAT